MGGMNVNEANRGATKFQFVTLDRTTVCADCGVAYGDGDAGVMIERADPDFQPWFRCQRCFHDRKGFSRWFMFRHDGHKQ